MMEDGWEGRIWTGKTEKPDGGYFRLVNGVRYEVRVRVRKSGIVRADIREPGYPDSIARTYDSVEQFDSRWAKAKKRR